LSIVVRRQVRRLEQVIARRTAALISASRQS
jgi:hypothetical protein